MYGPLPVVQHGTPIPCAASTNQDGGELLPRLKPVEATGHYSFWSQPVYLMDRALVFISGWS